MKCQNRKIRKKIKIAAMVGMGIAFGFAGTAAAFEIETDNPDVQMRWDNTVRYNAGMRVHGIGNVGNNPAFDEGEYKFGRGSIVTNRVDLLSEFDFVYKKDMGFRVSGAGWYDHAYRDAVAKRNPNLPATIAGSYVNDQYSSYTKRFALGPSGEILDAFVFGTVDLGEMPLSVKAGRHTVYWGESVLQAGGLHGISYSQMPLDLAKAFATPGIEAKELFLPLTNISAQLVATNELSFAAQYFLDWAPTRIPEGGTFLGPADFLMYGPDRVSAALVNGGMSRPKKRGDWGVNARWRPPALDGTVGIYYRNFTDKLPSVFSTGGQYREYFGEDIDLFGISLSKQIGDASVGMELSYRKNMALNGQTLGAVAPTAILIGNTYQARGNTFHAVLNATGIIPQNSIFNSANWVAEMTFVHLDKVTANRDMFFGLGNGVCDAGSRAALGTRFRDKWDGCSTRDAFGVALNFSPNWLQVYPGVDMSMPMSVGYGIKGNSPTALGGNQGNGSYSIGLGLDVDSRYRIDLRYVDYFGHFKEGPGLLPGTTQVTAANGLSTLLKDRGWVALTLKASF